MKEYKRLCQKHVSTKVTLRFVWGQLSRKQNSAEDFTYNLAMYHCGFFSRTQVGKAMSEEIRRLSVLVDEFNDPFHPDPLVLNVYKSRLNHHIEAGIGSNLKNRLSSGRQ